MTSHDSHTAHSNQNHDHSHYTVAIVGAGPGGLSIAAALIDQGLDPQQLTVLDRGAIGQAWLDYPADTHLLSESAPPKVDDNMIADVPTSDVFANIPHPSHVMYQKYLAHVADVKKIHVQENTTVEHVVFDMDSKQFVISLRGDTMITCDYLVWAAGMYSNPNDEMDMEGCSIHYAKLPYIDDIEATELTVVGGGNGASGVVMQLAKPGRKVFLVVSRKYEVPQPVDCLWKENMVFIQQLEREGLVDIIENFRVKKIYKDGGIYHLESQDGQHRTSPDKPIICTGFSPNISPIESLIDTVCSEDRELFINLDKMHQSVKTPGLFVGGSIGKLEHDEGFIRNFRKFAATIAGEILKTV